MPPRILAVACIALLCLSSAVAASRLNADEVAAGAPDHRLLVAEVVDDESGEPIKEFLALPGVGRLKVLGYRWQWQPHRIRKFQDGRLVWPPDGERGYTQEQGLRIEAEGYLPYVTPTIKQAGEPAEPRRKDEQPPELSPPLVITPGQPASLKVRLKRDPGIEGRVVDAQGQPLADATVAIGMGHFRGLHIRDGKLYIWPPQRPDESLQDAWSRPRQVQTDAAGRFCMPSEVETARVLVVHPYGMAALPYEECVSGHDIELQAWGAIEGQAIWNGVPASGEKIHLFAKNHLNEVVADVDGRFRFEHVPPGKVTLGRDSLPSGDWTFIATNPNATVDLPPGETIACTLGGTGRPIVGKVAGFDDWRNVSVSVHLDLHWPSYSVRSEDDPTISAFYGFVSSEYYRHYDKPPFGIESDGSFRLDDVPAERYAIVVTERRGDEIVCQGEGRFLVKMMPTGASAEPQDVGVIEIAPGVRTTSKKIELSKPAASK
ncbi:hypothetical protein [Lacipirellula sp.]|uniref:carboxypeptidase-like regulatory domain-containing protein n=1 Tax=Lacipirellula sp. TaxID=2691419 RepID=UPI003D0D1428